MKTPSAKRLTENERLLRRVFRRTMGFPESKLKASIRRAVVLGIDLNDARYCLKKAAKGAAFRTRSESTVMQHGTDAEAARSEFGTTDSRGQLTAWGLVKDDRHWKRLVREVEDDVDSSPSPEASRAAMVDALYVRLLKPLPRPESGKVQGNVTRDANVRAAWVYAMLKMIENADEQITARRALGIEAETAGILARNKDEQKAADQLARSAKFTLAARTVYVTGPRLAAEMGWTIPTANANLKYLTDIGYLQKANETGNKLFRLTELTTGERTFLEELNKRTNYVELHRSGTPSGLGNIVCAVTHPTFTYGLSHRHWLLSIADFTHTAAVEFGFAANGRLERQTRSELRERNLGWELASAHFPRRLDEEAMDAESGEPGPRVLKDAAVRKYLEAAQSKRNPETSYGGKKTRAFEIIDRMLQRDRIPRPPLTGKLPKDPERLRAKIERGKRDIRRWQISVQRQTPNNHDFRRVANERLQTQMRKAGYGPTYSRNAVQEILGKELSQMPRK